MFVLYKNYTSIIIWIVITELCTPSTSPYYPAHHELSSWQFIVRPQPCLVAPSGLSNLTWLCLMPVPLAPIYIMSLFLLAGITARPLLRRSLVSTCQMAAIEMPGCRDPYVMSASSVSSPRTATHLQREAINSLGVCELYLFSNPRHPRNCGFSSWVRLPLRLILLNGIWWFY